MAITIISGKSKGDQARISAAEMERRRRATDRARAANIRQGYVHDQVLEDITERFVRGEISLEEFGVEITAQNHRTSR